MGSDAKFRLWMLFFFSVRELGLGIWRIEGICLRCLFVMFCLLLGVRCLCGDCDFVDIKGGGSCNYLVVFRSYFLIIFFLFIIEGSGDRME